MLTAEAEAIHVLERQQELPRDLVEAVIDRMLSGACSNADASAFLVGLQRKGETVEELVGAAQAMRRAMIRIASDFTVLLDTCGTGGDGSQTFNISTAAAIVIAAAGVPVAKHGNRKVTSSTGSADVLAELGINLDASPDVVERCLNELKLCFCFAQRFHPAMKHVAETRRSIAGPTIFNRLGPLCNPASANRQVLGVGSAELQLKLARALNDLGTERSLVVRGEDGVDEVSLEAPTEVLEVGSPNPVYPADNSAHLIHSPALGVSVSGVSISDKGDVGSGGAVLRQVHMKSFIWAPANFGLEPHARASLFADSPTASAACIREALSGRPGACRDAVLINAAAGLWLGGQSTDLHQCVALAASAIDTGQATDLIRRLSELTHT